ncbi:MAG: ABC transporter permease [Patescibacteria group bacterium]
MPLNVKIGFFLAVRALRRASLWTTTLIIGVMILTFLNLVVLSGILVGLMQGAINAVRTEYTSDVIVSTLEDKQYIENSPDIIGLVASLPEVAAYTARYREPGTLEANYRTHKETDKPNVANAVVVGINPAKENAVTGIARDIVEGEFLAPGDYDKVVVGGYLLKQYFPVETPGFSTLDRVGIGTKIRVTVGGVTREVTVKGILKSKVDEVAMRAYFVDSQFRSLIGRNDGNVDEIAIKVKPGVDPAAMRDALLLRGAGEAAKVQTFEDAQPKFLKDIITTFNMLGAAFSSIGLVVASITIFIVVFINAITRRKFIGILKGIGINGRAIEISYIFQSIFYALVGSIFGLLLVYGFLVPFFAAHPIDFPFSDGILVAPVGETMVRVGLLVVSTLIAGYVPAWMIIRKNTLDSILGRN